MKSIAIKIMHLSFLSPLKCLFNNTFYSIIIAGLCIIMAMGCEKDEDPPPILTELTFVDIPAGTFTMGSNTIKSYQLNQVEHQVTLSAFKMSKYEITNAQYAEFLNSKNIGKDGKYAEGMYPTITLFFESSFIDDWGLHYTNEKWIPAKGYENHPVINMTWFGAAEFATYIGGYLPTEAQWEYACRSKTTTLFNTGECLTYLQANYNWINPYNVCINPIKYRPNKTQAVGTYPPNAYGLHDMHGNVSEWCSDLGDDYPTTPQTDPTGPTNTTLGKRIIRGGSWLSSDESCYSAFRFHSQPYWGGSSDGFRVVRIP